MLRPFRVSCGNLKIRNGHEMKLVKWPFWCKQRPLHVIWASKSVINPSFSHLYGHWDAWYLSSRNVELYTKTLNYTTRAWVVPWEPLCMQIECSFKHNTTRFRYSYCGLKTGLWDMLQLSFHLTKMWATTDVYPSISQGYCVIEWVTLYKHIEAKTLHKLYKFILHWFKP